MNVTLAYWLVWVALVVGLALFLGLLFAPLIAHERWSRKRRGRGGMLR